MSYLCRDCRFIGEPDYHRVLDKVDSGAARYAVALTCPDCDGDDLVEVALCLDCADNGVDTLATHEDYCAECAAANFDGDNLEDFRRDQIWEVKALVTTKESGT